MSWVKLVVKDGVLYRTYEETSPKVFGEKLEEIFFESDNSKVAQFFRKRRHWLHGVEQATRCHVDIIENKSLGNFRISIAR